MHLQPVFAPQNPWGRPLRILIVIAYLAALTLLLEQSSSQPVVGPVAPKAYDPVWDAMLTGCHIIGFSLLVILMWGALVNPAPSRWALIVTVIFALVYGYITEVVQTLVPDRSSSWSDLLVDWGVTLAAAYFIKTRLSRWLLDELPPSRSIRG